MARRVNTSDFKTSPWLSTKLTFLLHKTSRRQIGEEGEPGRQVDIVTPQQKIQPQKIDAATVSNVVIDDESVSFSVDKVGTPILVKVSYFPNWTVSGAKEVYRAAPNMMVVVPTEKNVRMSYEPSNLDQFAYILTFAGIVLVVFMFRRRLRYGTSLPSRTSGGSEVSAQPEDPAGNLSH